MKTVFFVSLLCLFGTELQARILPNLVCYYNSNSFLAQGLAQYTLDDLERALQFCTHIVYGYAGITPDTFQITSLNKKLDIHRRHFAMITELKERNPHIKFLLSVGGDHDLENPEKYMHFLESGRLAQSKFIESARDLLRSYNFDGLDLAFQFPKNKPRKVHTDVEKVWKSVKKFFTGDQIVDELAHDHRQQFTDLVKDIKEMLNPYNLMLTLTVLPNVNSSWYYDAPAIIDSIDFVNLAAFDFLTPERNPKEADYTAPLYESYGTNRLGHYNVVYQVEYWIDQRVPRKKIVVGIPSFGRAWKMTNESGTTGTPIVSATDGPAPAGPQTHIPGLLSWPEICSKLPNPSNMDAKGPLAPLHRVAEPTKSFGTYAFRAADQHGANGIWVSYEDPETAAYKAGYVKAQTLGGVALFELGLDDFRGQCNGQKYPILRAIKHRLF